MGVTHPVGPASGSWDQIRALGPSEDLQGPPRTSGAPKRAFLGLSGYLYDPRAGQNVILLCVMYVGSALVPFETFHGNIWSVAPFIPVGMWAGPKISILAPWKIFNEWPCPSFSDIIIDPKDYFSCDFNQFEDDVFEKNQLFCIPYLGPKWPFFGPERPILTRNLKNIV